MPDEWSRVFDCFCAVQVVREWLPSLQACLRINIDATRQGNVARFFNHSCGGGNLELAVVRYKGSPMPIVGIFARTNISPGEELTFTYGEPHACAPCSDDGTGGAGQDLQIRRPCHCGAEECLGWLPADTV
jgi:histone-lysine N-methyltransferase SETMAR